MPDPGLPITSCDMTTGSGCLGNVEMLKLVGKDIGMSHNSTGTTAFDGNIDTWICHPDWSCTGSNVSATERLPA